MKIDLSYYRDQLFKELYDSGISLKTINAMKKIHREKFIPLSYRHLAYENRPIIYWKRTNYITTLYRWKNDRLAKY